MITANFKTATSLVFLSAAIFACASPQVAPPQSPSSERDPAARTTSDGQVIGADGVPPAQKLEQGARIDSDRGAEPAATPGNEPK